MYEVGLFLVHLAVLQVEPHNYNNQDMLSGAAFTDPATGREQMALFPNPSSINLLSQFMKIPLTYSQFCSQCS